MKRFIYPIILSAFVLGSSFAAEPGASGVPPAAPDSAAAERAAAERAAAMRWKLSERERAIVRSLGGD